MNWLLTSEETKALYFSKMSTILVRQTCILGVQVTPCVFPKYINYEPPVVLIFPLGKTFCWTSVLWRCPRKQQSWRPIRGVYITWVYTDWSKSEDWRSVWRLWAISAVSLTLKGSPSMSRSTGLGRFILGGRSTLISGSIVRGGFCSNGKLLETRYFLWAHEVAKNEGDNIIKRWLAFLPLDTGSPWVCASYLYKVTRGHCTTAGNMHIR